MRSTSNLFPILCLSLALLLLVLALGVKSYATGTAGAVLPNGWVIGRSTHLFTETDTFPQGAAGSPNAKLLAVVESGFNSPTLRIFDVASLEQIASVELPGAFGRPLWLDDRHLLVAGANADAILSIDLSSQSVRTIALPKHSYPTAIAMHDSTLAVATDGDMSVRIGTIEDIATSTPLRIGGHIGGLAFSENGAKLFVSDSSGSSLVDIDVAARTQAQLRTRLHPTDILTVGGYEYVAESDADTVAVYDAASGERRTTIFVGDRSRGQSLDGTSPNALAALGDRVFVSLGAANAVAVLERDRVTGRIEAGWYPSDIVPIGGRLYVIDGKGEGTTPNPYWNPMLPSNNYYIPSIQYGSIRAYDVATAVGKGNAQGARGWGVLANDPIVRSGGPIKHVFFVLKENRSYDEVLGDMTAGNGDSKIAWFGRTVTPNEHAFADRFGLFDDTYASGEVSESGHLWADAAFVNDYIERSWPSVYANRDTVDDSFFSLGTGAPRNGYLWQAALKAHVSFRDYGEMANMSNPLGAGSNKPSAIRSISDTRYIGWNLDYSDLAREKEWNREFVQFDRTGSVPQLEYIWLPNDHTYGSRVGKFTPAAYIAQNDFALGRLVDTISHSSIWRSSAIFIIEDDAQDGPDHVSDQRTTFFLVSPYARGGLQHNHYSTLSVVRTMELLLGIKPLSAYDTMAVPLYAAFTSRARFQPYAVLPPQISLDDRNRKTAYGAALSAKLDFAEPDAVAGDTMRQLLAKNHQTNGRR